jgi:hypothetical protein
MKLLREKDYSGLMKMTITAAGMAVALLGSSAAFAGQEYEPPRTASGHPDLQGVWNFSSNVPMQRPERFGDREFMTAEEVAQMRARLAAADAASDQAVPQRDGAPADTTTSGSRVPV